MSDYKLCDNGHYYQEDECPYCKRLNTSGIIHRDPIIVDLFDDEEKMYDDQIEYKLCASGHYYRGDNCPYCPQQEPAGKRFIRYEKSCPNRHAYDAQEQECPICGSKEVVSEYEYRKDTIENQYVIFDVPEVNVNGERIYGVKKVLVYVVRGNRYNYAFIDQMRKEHSFDPGDDIQIGVTRLKGREIMRMCDMAMDNNLSVLNIK